MTGEPVIVEIVPATQTSELRRSVLRPAWPPGAPMPGDDRPDARHLAARAADGRVIASAVLVPEPVPAVIAAHAGESATMLRGMVVAEEHRGTGIGAMVLAEARRLARADGSRLLWCVARVPAEGFYAGAGFTAVGEVFFHSDSGVDHRVMYCEL